MTVSLLLVAATCLGVVALAPGLALAQQGRIGFSGRIVEPTCDRSDATISDIDKPPHHVNCDRATSPAPARGYALSVTHLDGHQEDLVLSYFATYVRATKTGTPMPVLLTKIYD